MDKIVMPPGEYGVRKMIDLTKLPPGQTLWDLIASGMIDASNSLRSCLGSGQAISFKDYIEGANHE